MVLVINGTSRDWRRRRLAGQDELTLFPASVRLCYCAYPQVLLRPIFVLPSRSSSLRRHWSRQRPGATSEVRGGGGRGGGGGGEGGGGGGGGARGMVREVREVREIRGSVTPRLLADDD